MSARPVYLDYQATTPTDPRVLDAMLPFFDERFGNPHSINHLYGWDAAQALDIARACAARLIGANVSEIIFTSGATESCNLALRGAAKAASGERARVVTIETEHPAVYETAADLGRGGFEAVFLGVDSDGILRLEELESVLDERVLMVSVMAANNEIGVLQPMREIAERCRAVGALLHTDATQAAGRIPIDAAEWGVDLLSFSAHKMYGPKGVGALYVRDGTPIEPILTGGGQERGLRPGTAPVPLAVGLGEACRIASAERQADARRMDGLTRRLYAGLQELRPDVRVFGCMRRRLPGSLSVGFHGVSADGFVAAAQERVAVSTGSACASATAEPSRTLLALGLDPETAAEAFRVSLGRFTTENDIETALEAFAEALAPFPSPPAPAFIAERRDEMNQDAPKLDLRFRSGDPAGFTPTGVAGFSELPPAAAVRELIQNSLDAAKAAGRDTAVVRFELSQTATNELPGIKSYRKAFEAAKRTHRGGGELPRQAQMVADQMEAALQRETVDVLTVYDNGIGLDKQRMEALLSDGVSVKEEGATGSFGNGHMVAIPASDLRYVLYGGVTKDGSRIGSGHAVLASHHIAGERQNRSANGYLALGFSDGGFDFAHNMGGGYGTSA